MQVRSLRQKSLNSPARKTTRNEEMCCIRRSWRRPREWTGECAVFLLRAVGGRERESRSTTVEGLTKRAGASHGIFLWFSVFFCFFSVMWRSAWGDRDLGEALCVVVRNGGRLEGVLHFQVGYFLW